MPKASPAQTTSLAAVRKALQAMPNVGPRTADDLVRLGIRSIDDLVDRDPMQMYEAISAMDGVPHDPCVIDVFMAVVDHARTGVVRDWWTYTPERKAMLARTTKKRPSKASRK